MRFTSLTILTAAAIASAAILPPPSLNLISNPTISSQPSVATLTSSFFQTPNTNLSLPLSIEPEKGFKVIVSVSSGLLPVNSAFINVLFFMTAIAEQDFTYELQPRSFSTPNYRDVQITNFAWTESRFLLWGVYFGISYMVKYLRFHEMTLQLWFEDQVVGKMAIVAKRGLSLGDGDGNSTTQDLVARSDAIGGEMETNDDGAVADNNVIGSDPAALVSSAYNASSDFTITFSDIQGAKSVNRNDLFLTFYTAVLHIARYPVTSRMQSFESFSANQKLVLHMQEFSLGCSYGVVNAALFYVPQYMMQHRNFGYRETDFMIKLKEKAACLGTIIQVK